MDMQSSKVTRRLTLAAIVSICLAGWGLNGVLASLNISPGHLRLVKVLRTNADTEGTAYSQIKAVADSRNERRKMAGREDLVNSTSAVSSRRVYREPSESERAALLSGLGQKLRTMQVGDFISDQAALSAYKDLFGEQGGTRLAGGDWQVEVPADAVTEVEPNDDWASAQELAIGDTLSGDAVPFEDVDVYSFEATAGDYVRIEALPIEEDILGGYAVVSLYDPDSTQIFGGYYIFYEYGLDDMGVSRSADAIDSRLIWPGGSLVAAGLDKPGTYRVVVQMYPGNIRWLDSGMIIPEDSGQYDKIPYRLTLDKLETSNVEGLVMDDHGSAIEGARVDLWSQEGIGGAHVVTDENGKFVTALPSGNWGVNIEGPVGGPYPTGQQQEGFLVEDSDLSVEFELARGVIFAGTIETDRGELAPYVGFSLVGANQRQYQWGQSDEDGNFSVAVFPDTFEVFLHPGYLYPPQPVIEGIRILSDTSSYKLIIDSGFKLSGRLLDGDGEPVANTWVQMNNEMVYRSFQTNATGEYEIYLPEGSYWVEVRPYDNTLIPAQIVGPFDISADSEMDIQLEKGGILSGSVYDDRGNPVPYALVNVWTSDGITGREEPKDTVYEDEAGIIYSTGSDTIEYPDLVDPASKVAGVLPRYFQYSTDEEGNWSMALLEGEYNVDITSPYPYPSQRISLGSFTVEKGSEVDAGRTELYYGVLFSGRVTIGGNEPLAWGGFEISTEINDSIYYFDDMPIKPEPVISKWVSTDEDGAFSVQLTPGTYNMLFDPNYSGRMSFPRQWVRGVELTADRQMDIALEAGQTISGIVVNEDGKGLDGSRLDFYDSKGTWNGMAVCSNGGEFSVVLAAGDYNAVVTPVKGYFTESTSYAVSAPSNTQIEIVARSGVRVSGRVTASDGHPLGGVVVQLLPQIGATTNENVRQNQSLVSLASYLAGDGTPMDSVVGSDGDLIIVDPFYPKPVEPGQLATRTDYDGNWELVVRPGVYDIYATNYSYGYANAFLPGVDCTAEVQVDLVLEAAEIVFEGRVNDADGRPVPGTLISLFDPENGGQMSGFTDESGNFRFDMPLGDYELFVEGPNSSNSLPTTDRVKLDGNRQVLIQLGKGLLGQEQDGPQLPRAFALGQNVPNPFNPSTTISYALDEESQVKLAVFDIRGRTVAVLVDRVQDEGDYSVQWDGTDRSGRQLASGIYIYRLQAGGNQMTRKMVLIK